MALRATPAQIDALLRYSAFSSSPEGGNPAGVVLDASDLTDPQMLAIAAHVGYSETAVLIARALSQYRQRRDALVRVEQQALRAVREAWRESLGGPLGDR